MGIEIILTYLFAVKIILRIEVLDLTGKAGLEFGGIKAGDRAGATYSFNQIIPILFDSIPQRRNSTKASYYNSSQSSLLNG
jgi:hypothetical protein